MPLSSEFNYDTGEKRIVKTLKLHFVSYIFMNIFIDLSMVIYQIVDKDRIWLTNWYKSTNLSKLIDKRKKNRIRLNCGWQQTQVGHTTSESYNLSNKKKIMFWKESRPSVLRNIGQGQIGKTIIEWKVLPL